MAFVVNPTELKRETLDGYTAYIAEADASADLALREETAFLWSDGHPERARQLNEGRTVVEQGPGKQPVKVPDGLLHDWVGAIRVPGATVGNALAVVQDYGNHKNIYRPEVMDSKLLSRSGDDFEIYLRLLKKKVVTVVLDTWHAVHYGSIDARRWYCRSCTTRISEIEDVGQPKEMARLPDTGYGFLWRLYSHWRFEERDDAVYIECRAISLTRDIPAALNWIISPMVKKLPMESLAATLESTRRALSATPTGPGIAPLPGAM